MKQRANNAAKSALELLRTVLSSEELRVGTPRVVSLNEEVGRRFRVDVRDEFLSFFLVTANGVWAEVSELIVLVADSAPSEEQKQFLSDLITRVLELDSVRPCESVAVVGEHLDGLRLPKEEVCAARVVTPTECLHRLLPLPSHFDSRLMDCAKLERSSEFLRVFQRRLSIVQSVPDAIQSATLGVPSKGDRVDLDQYLQQWLGEHNQRAPVLLLGERGAGKSWQLLHFAQTAHEMHVAEPWKYGPAFFVRLRELVRMAADSTAARPVLTEYILRKYLHDEARPASPAFLGALLAAGHAVVCVDGFDEIDVLPNNEKVRAKFSMLLLLLSTRTRFVVTSRAEHFQSLRSLLDLQGGRDTTVASTFEVLELWPFDGQSKMKYISDTMTDSERKRKTKQLLRIFSEPQSEPLKRALSICGSHPATLAHLVDAAGKGTERPLELISDAIISVFIEFNIARGRTEEGFLTDSGAYVGLSVDDRIELLEELAWYMAERRIDAVDVARLPTRMRLRYGLDNEAIQRDLRSQTVMELVAPEEEMAGAERVGRRTDGETATAGDEGSLGESDVETADDVSSEASPISPIQFTLRGDPEAGEGVGESSVTGAYFLAGRILRKLLEERPIGEVPAALRLEALGSVEVGAMSGAILREMVQATPGAPKPRELGLHAWRHLRALSQKKQLRVFLPAYRFLARSLAQIGGLTKQQAEALTPWTERTNPVVRPPSGAPDYQMVLVPRPTSDDASGPFLLGVHEVTNNHYLEFIQSDPRRDDTDSTIRGREWSVSRMTVAGSAKDEKRGAGSLSRNHVLSNEYHLFFWLPSSKKFVREQDRGGTDAPPSQRFEPPSPILQHPVTYVSWYAAAAYCDWLSLRDSGCRRCYVQELQQGIGSESLQTDEVGRSQCGYRLPTRNEWTWAAKCGHADIERPWQMYPYYLPQVERRAVALRRNDDKASEAYMQTQDIMRQVLLESGKDTRPVLYVEFNEFGLSGLIGNVREWCHDAVEKDHEPMHDHRLILGATGYLGESTFDFEYETWLFPRNTNPDVGFRVARTLRQEETDALEKREAEIANLPADPPDGLGSSAK